MFWCWWLWELVWRRGYVALACRGRWDPSFWSGDGKCDPKLAAKGIQNWKQNGWSSARNQCLRGLQILQQIHMKWWQRLRRAGGVASQLDRWVLFLHHISERHKGFSAGFSWSRPRGETMHSLRCGPWPANTTLGPQLSHQIHQALCVPAVQRCGGVS